MSLKALHDWLHPNVRPLAEGERFLARSIFGDTLDLDAVKIHTARWVLPQYAVTPNGSIYFNPREQRDDYSRAPLSTQAWFIHEMVHVWQYQQGIKVFRRALLDRRYRYILEAGKQFLNYGIEQQAQMVQDYFTKQQTGQDCTELAACIPFLKTDTA